MNIIYLRDDKLSQEQILELRKEFPQYEFFTQSDIEHSPLELLKANYWNYVEIFYGTTLSSTELAKANRLRWVHSPLPHINEIQIERDEQQKNILITNTPEKNSLQISEFVMAATFSFAKRLFHWHDTKKENKTWGEESSQITSWSLKDKVFLQIGLGPTGNAITKMAKNLGFRTWGIAPQRSFHRHCDKSFSFPSLHSLLPGSDVVSIALPKNRDYQNWFHKSQLELMKEDSILIVISPSGVIDEEALAELAEKNKFRGIILDSCQQSPLPKSSPLWTLPQLLLTPSIATLPQSEEQVSFSLFHNNLRQYVHGNTTEMKQLVGKRISY